MAANDAAHDHETRAAAIADRLLPWYAANARTLPWRALPGAPPADPYRVWLSEIMLQQTTVAAVIPYFLDFTERWPDVGALAEAPRAEVLSAWAGLGYYARARNLHACAQIVAGERGGIFPDTEPGLRELPGIGPYTAAAVAAIAFGRDATPVDGNIERVMARVFAVETPLPAAKPELKAFAVAAMPAGRAGDFAQALMDLGATICIPKTPRCGVCPLAGICGAHAAGIAVELPRRTRRKAKPERYGIAWFVQRPDGAVWLRRRPDAGLLGGMTEVPGGEWRGIEAPRDETPPADLRWRVLPGVVRHTFTHFRLELEVRAAEAGAGEVPHGFWALPVEFDAQALPSVMRKVLAHALKKTAS
jgi:A/G-specific adenine glycosylase